MDVPQIGADCRKRKKMIEMKKKMNSLTKEQLKAALEKKKVCNAKAMTIVERLIEPDVEESWLLENLFHINQSHYQDAVEERAIVKCCGYPLCNGSLEDVPRKQYHISTKQNKVYDITDRKNYCSNLCYKASTYLKDQMYTSPLWLRDCEDVVDFKLFSPMNKTGSTGLEVDLGNISPVKSDEDIECVDMERVETSEDNCIIISFNEDISESSDGAENTQSNHNMDRRIKKQKINDDVKCNNASVKEYVIESTDYSQGKKNKIKETFTRIEKNENKVSRKMTGHGLSAVERVDISLESWFTADSLLFLYGEDKLKEILEEFGSPTDRFGQLINTKDAFLYERYSEICKRLNFIELKEKIEEREEMVPKKPVPDYEALKNAARDLEIKVRTFYLGDKVSFQGVHEENVKSKEEVCDDKAAPPVLPLIDKHGVLATRRRIVLDKIYKTLPDIQSALGLAHFNIRHEVQEFVHTLALTASNIIFSPSEWNLISVIMIKLFTLRNELLEYAFSTDLTQKRIINLLLAYKLDIHYLQKCVIKLRNIEQIVKNSQ